MTELEKFKKLLTEDDQNFDVIEYDNSILITLYKSIYISTYEVDTTETYFEFDLNGNLIKIY